MSDTIISVRLNAHQAKVLDELARFRQDDTWATTGPTRSEYIRNLIRDDYKRAVTQGMEPIA